MRRTGLSLLLLLVTLVLAGYSDFVDVAQPNAALGLDEIVDGSHTVGQTFVACHAGLSGVEVWMEPRRDGQGEIYLHLRADPQAADDLATAVLPLAQVVAPGFYRFSFPPLRDSHSRYYYAFLEVAEDGTVQVGAGPGEAYLDGALYRDHQPLDAQMAFRLVYDPRWMLLDLAWASMCGLGLLAVAGLLYVVPGWALLSWLWPKKLSWAERLGLAAGLSLALYPLLLLWTDLVGLHLGPLYAWLPMALGIIVLLWHYRPWQIRWSQALAALKRWLRSKTLWPDAALIVVVALSGMGRLLMARGLEMPLWDDSVQHTVIVKRILESGGLFRSWEPYAPYHTYSSHFGFHANVAAWAWLTRSNVSQAMIWAGQAMNLLAVLTLYPLAYRIKGVWGGVTAILAAGLFTEFPVYYTNWGRYPQMCGQAILPVAAWWIWVVLEQKKWSPLQILGGVCLVAGMILTYYRMAFHLLAFVVAALLVTFMLSRRVPRRWNWLVLIGVATVTGILLAPWLYNVGTRYPLVPVGSGVSSQEEAAGFWQQIQTIYIGWPAPMAAVVFLGTLIGISAGGTAALPAVWLWMLVALPILRLTNLPAVQIIQEFTIETSLYIPQALIWGTFVGHLADKAIARNRWRAALLALTIIVIGVWKLPSLLAVLDRGFDLSTRPDIRAAKWIDESLPDDAFFLVNGIVYTDGYSAVGGDGGWWLPILTRRSVVIPPQYALVLEQPNEPGYSEAVNKLVQRLFDNSPSTPEGREIICRFPRPITYVYLGQRRGMVAKAIHPPPHPMLPAELLLQDTAFRLIYHQDRVMIFEFDRAVCP